MLSSEQIGEKDEKFQAFKENFATFRRIKC